MTLGDDVPAPTSSPFAPDEVIVYGIPLDSSPTILGQTDEGIEITLDITAAKRGETSDATNPIGIAVIYGYAYEGRCYRLDKPKVLVLSRHTAAQDWQVDANGCGFDNSYKMWRVRAADYVLELNTSVGRIRTALLEANQPGKRPPNTYAAHMQLAHRSGRLME